MKNERREELQAGAVVLGAIVILDVLACLVTGRWELFLQILGTLFGIVFYAGGGFTLLLWLSILIHELGHLCLVRLTGGVPLQMTSLRIVFYFQEGRYSTCRWRKSQHAGFVQYVPQSSAILSKLVILLAGPLANVLVGWGAWLVVDRTMQAEGIAQQLHDAAYALMWMNAFLAFASLLPYQPKGQWPSDGMQIFRALRNPKGTQEALVRSKAMYHDLLLRPRDIDPERVIGYLDPQGVTIYREMVHYWHETDADRIANGEPWLRVAWAKMPKDGKQASELHEACAYETAIYFTRFMDDPELAREAAAWGEKHFPKSDRRVALACARAWVAGDRDEANRLIRTIWKRTQDIQGSKVLIEHVNDCFGQLIDPRIPVFPSRETAANEESLLGCLPCKGQTRALWIDPR